MEVTQVRVSPVTKKYVRAMVEVVIDDKLIINDLQLIVDKSGKLRLHYPTSQSSWGGKIKNIVKPIDRKLQQKIENAAVEKYFEIRKS